MNDFLEFGSAGGDDRGSVGITSGVGTRSIGWGGDDGGGLVETMISEAGEAMVVEQRRTISICGWDKSTEADARYFRITDCRPQLKE